MINEDGYVADFNAARELREERDKALEALARVMAERDELLNRLDALGGL